MLSFAQLRTAGVQSSICIGATDTAQHIDLALTTVTWWVDGWINVRLDAWLIVGCVNHCDETRFMEFSRSLTIFAYGLPNFVAYQNQISVLLQTAF
jgi:hypothetical protein